MNKQQNRLLGLDKIYDLIEVPAEFLEAVKRYKLGQEKLSEAELRLAYQRRAAIIRHLTDSPNTKWQDLLAHINEINPTNCCTTKPAIHDLFELKRFVYHYQALRSYTLARKLAFYELPDLAELFILLDPEKGNIPSFRLSPLYSNALQELDKQRQELSQRLKHQRQMHLSEARTELGIPELKEEFALSRFQTELISKIQHSKHFSLKQESIANLIYSLAESPETLRLKAEIAALNRELESEEEKVLTMLGKEVSRFTQALKTAVHSVKELGWDYSLAAFAKRYECCIPEIADRIRINRARNLPLQLHLETHNRHYQRPDLEFCTGANLITGPNMGGKTSILKCIAQFAQLLNRAIPLPADQASMPAYDFVFYNHVHEGENLSSFGSEVVAFCEALKRPGRGLFLLDEFAKGTNPREGEALATAVIRYLAASRHTTVAATHFTAPAMLKEIRQFQIKGISTSSEDSSGADLAERLRQLNNAMDFSLILLEDSKNPPMDALRIAELLGLPPAILELVTVED
jgi:DNA mismatch repair ATPase MutS